MYKQQRPTRTTIQRNESMEGETIEKKVERIVNNKEPITDGAPIIFTPRENGAEPAYDIRTDRFELAVGAMDKKTMAHLAQREGRINDKKDKSDKAKNDADKAAAAGEGIPDGKGSNGDTGKGGDTATK